MTRRGWMLVGAGVGFTGLFWLDVIEEGVRRGVGEAAARGFVDMGLVLSGALVAVEVMLWCQEEPAPASTSIPKGP